MEIVFASDKLRKLCNDRKKIQKKYGQNQGRKLRRRLDDLDAANVLEDCRLLPGDCHELKGTRAHQLAMDLAGGYRLIFEAAHNPTPRKEDGGLDWAQVTAVRILEIEDYHD